MRWFVVLPGLTAGLLAGLFIAVPFKLPAGGPPGPKSAAPAFDLERLPDAELETLALDALTRLNEKRGVGGLKGRPSRAEFDPRRVYLGIENVKRLLPLGKRLTLQALAGVLKTSGLSRERRLITSVRRVVFDASLGDAVGVSEHDLSTIRVGPGYATYLISDDEAMLVLGHELTHVAARGGRLQPLIEDVSRVARESAGLALSAVQEEELACDYTGAEVLKRYIALRPTARSGDERFASAFNLRPRPERLARAWQDFCTSYNGDPADEEHLSLTQTFRILPRLNPELQTLITDDAFSTRLCR